jgi:mono/diheme cytochrome c family protein
VRVSWQRIGIVVTWIIGVPLGVLVVATAWALVRYPLVWDRPTPEIHSSADPAAVERGRYIVFGPGRCADCHTPDAAREALSRGETVPLSGGPGERTYLGTWTAPNLTPDETTGIGRVTDGQIARMIRYGINRSGHAALPFMDAFANLTDDDLSAVLSFLRSQPAVPGVAPRADVNLLGKISLVYFITPYSPTTTPAVHLTPEPTAAYGEYIARALAGCGACHTARDLQTGEYLSPPFSGGLAFKSRLHPDSMYVSPNLTPDPSTGHITGWTEDMFVSRFRQGLLYADSPMPWGGFQRMTDTDLRALYRYLHALPPVRHDVGPSVQAAHGQTAG